MTYPPQEPGLGETYAASSYTRLAAGRKREFLLHPSGRVTGPLHTNVVAILEQCREFKTLGGHSAGLCSNLGIPPEFLAVHDPMAPILADLQEWGLLISSSELLGSAVASCLPIAPADIDAVGIVTCDRPSALHRALHSYIGNVRRHGRAADFFVFDDSAPQTLRRSSAVVEQAAAQTGGSVYYADRSHKEQYARTLARRAQVDPAIVRFALLGAEECDCSIGANRNALTLATVGRLIVSLDDDTTARIAPHPRQHETLRFSSERHPCDWWFYSNRPSAFSAWPAVDADLLSLHERYLGRSIGGLIGAHQVDFRGDAIVGQVVNACKCAAGRIRLTLPGVLGDSGMYTSWSLLLCEGEAFQRLIESESQFRMAIASRDLLRVSPCVTLDALGYGTATSLGIDNRDLSPPFMPVLRNEDGVFAAILAACYPGDFSAQLPWAIEHDPIAPSRHLYYLDSLRHIRFSDILLHCIASCGDTLTLQPAHRMAVLGKQLQQLGAMPSGDFVYSLRLWTCQAAGRRIAALENALERESGAPAYWVNDVHAAMEILREAPVSSQYVVPVDLLPGRSHDEATQLAQRLVCRFGQLLCEWPAVVHCASELAAGGVLIAPPVASPVAGLAGD